MIASRSSFGALSDVQAFAMQQAQPLLDSVKIQVRAEAAAGAREAVKPWIIGVAAASGIAMLVALAAYARGRH